MSIGPTGFAATGPTGRSGETSPLAATGSTGSTGPTGPNGEPGNNFGPQGPQGDTGSTGPDGVTGATGSSRPFSETGTFLSQFGYAGNLFSPTGLPPTMDHVLSESSINYTVLSNSLIFCSVHHEWGPPAVGPTGALVVSMPFNGSNSISFANLGAMSGVTGSAGVGTPFVGVVIPTEVGNPNFIYLFASQATGDATPASNENLVQGVNGFLNLSVVYNINPDL